jgi:hypothetical protein
MYLGLAWALELAQNEALLGWNAIGWNGITSWKVDSDQVKQCPFDSFSIAPRPLPHGFALVDDAVQPARSRLVALETDGEQPCTFIPNGGADIYALSPSGRAVAWTATESERQGNVVFAVGTLWATTVDGGPPRKLAHGPVVEPIAFQREDRLLFRVDARDTTGLGWLSLDEPSPREHALAVGVLGDPVILDGRWLTQIVDRLHQDGTGTLSIIDVEASREWPIATQVIRSFAPHWPQSDPQREVPLLYEVRGTSPSPADGYWLVRLRPGELR